MGVRTVFRSHVKWLKESTTKLNPGKMEMMLVKEAVVLQEGVLLMSQCNPEQSYILLR